MKKKRVQRRSNVVDQEYTDIPVKVTPVFRKIQNATKPIIANCGGAGSSKTYSLCQYFIFKRLLVRKNYNALALRKSRQSMKLSTYRTFINMLKMYGIYREVNHNQSDMVYVFPENNNMIQFSGLDNTEKIKSTEWDDVWVEEASEFDKEELLFLNTRKYRGEKKYDDISRIYLSFNPVMCYALELEGNKNVDYIHSTYKDNPFCNEDYQLTLESLKDEDDAYYKIYALGLPAQYGNIIYNPYIIDISRPALGFIKDEFYGLDFGFNKQTALIKVGDPYNGGKDLYLTELIYESRLTTPELIDRMKECIPEDKRKDPIYADSEDPGAIQEIYDAGFNILPAAKGKGSVREGIIFCKRFNYHITEDDANVKKESKTYKWKVDKNGKTLDEPVKFRDHSMDAKRYAVHNHLKDKMNPVNPKQFSEDMKEGTDSIASKPDWD